MENRCRVISCVKSVKVSQGTKIASWLCGYDSLKPILSFEKTRALASRRLGISQVKVSNEGALANSEILVEMKSG